jgi:hypothetical protein
MLQDRTRPAKETLKQNKLPINITVRSRHVACLIFPTAVIRGEMHNTYSPHYIHFPSRKNV